MIAAKKHESNKRKIMKGHPCFSVVLVELNSNCLLQQIQQQTSILAFPFPPSHSP